MGTSWASHTIRQTIHLGILRAFLAAIIVTPKCSSHLSSGQPHTKRPSSGQDLPRIPHWAEQPSGRKEGGGRVCIKRRKKSIRVSPVLRAVPCAVFWDLENDGLRLFIRQAPRGRRNRRLSAEETPRRPPRTPKLSSHLLQHPLQSRARCKKNPSEQDEGRRYGNCPVYPK